MNVTLVRLLHSGRVSGGPWYGMWALQQALERVIKTDGVDWLHIADSPVDGSIPWFWDGADRLLAADCSDKEQPFILGPNVLFISADNPRCDDIEAKLLDAASCQAMFCHSSWYRDLIRQNLGPESRADIWLWPYPVDPLPPPPAKNTEWDVLIFRKRGKNIEGIIREVQQHFPDSVVLRYGKFQRDEFYDKASRSRSCLYLSCEESGGLATQEAMIAGCPVVGVEMGAPLILHGKTGLHVKSWDTTVFLAALQRCLQFDRRLVRETALQMFDPDTIARTVIDYLDRVRHRSFGQASA